MQRFTVFSLVVLGIAACQKPAKNKTAPEKEGSQHTVTTGNFHNDAAVPPNEYFTAVQERAIDRARKLTEDNTSIFDVSQVLYVNFNGATVKKGFLLEQSFIPCKATSVIPAPNLDSDAQDAVISIVEKHFSDVGVKIEVTKKKPEDTYLFTTIHVGGTYGSLGCPDNGQTLGIAPLDKRNINPSDVAFVFADRLEDQNALAVAIAHEAAHSFGLDHVRESNDIMYASLSEGPHIFSKATLANGTIQDEPVLLRKNVGSLSADSSDSSTSSGSATGSATDSNGLFDILSWSNFFKTSLSAMDALFNGKFDFNAFSGNNFDGLLDKIKDIFNGGIFGNDLSENLIQLDKTTKIAKILGNVLKNSNGSTSKEDISAALDKLSAEEIETLKSLFGADLFETGTVSEGLKKWQDDLLSGLSSDKLRDFIKNIRDELLNK